MSAQLTDDQLQIKPGDSSPVRAAKISLKTGRRLNLADDPDMVQIITSPPRATTTAPQDRRRLAREQADRAPAATTAWRYLPVPDMRLLTRVNQAIREEADRAGPVRPRPPHDMRSLLTLVSQAIGETALLIEDTADFMGSNTLMWGKVVFLVHQWDDEVDIEPGDRVLYEKHEGKDVTVEGKDFRLLSADKVKKVLSPGEALRLEQVLRTTMSAHDVEKDESRHI